MSERFLSVDGERATDLDRAIIIANYYYTTPYLGYRSFKNYLNEIHVDQHDLIAYLDKLQGELDFILDIQDEINYQYQVEKLHSIIPQKVETVIERGYIDEVLSIDGDDVAHNPESVAKHLKEISIAAYRFQLKYCMMALMQIVNDGEVWDRGGFPAIVPDEDGFMDPADFLTKLLEDK